MPKDSDHLHVGLTDEPPGWMANLLADEDSFDRRVLWRLGTWAGGSVAALVVAVLVAQSTTSLRRERAAFAELTRQTQQVQWIAKESQDEARRLAAAVDTLNGDRDRLYSRVTVLEQGLDSVTGSVNRQTTTGPATIPSPAASVAPVASTPTSPAAGDSGAVAPDKKTDSRVEQKSEKTDAPQSDVTSSISAMPDTADAAADKAVQRTEFGVDIGTANSVEGLRALWRGVLKTQNTILGKLQPIIVVKERTDGLGLQLRLVAGPLGDAAKAAKICARLIESKRECGTSVYDGQRLALDAEKPAATPAPATSRQPRRRSGVRVEETAPKQFGLSTIFTNR